MSHCFFHSHANIAFKLINEKQSLCGCTALYYRMISNRVAQEVKYDFSLPLAEMEQYLPGQSHLSILQCPNEITAMEKQALRLNFQGSNHDTAPLCDKCNVTYTKATNLNHALLKI